MAARHVVYVRLDEAQRALRNPKEHAKSDIKGSISHHGFVEVPVVDERTGRLVAGHGRLDQLLELHRAGAKVPDGVEVDNDGMWRMPVVRGWSSASDEEAEAYLVASNRLTEKGGWDERLRVEVLGDLDQADLLTLTGYTSDDLNEMIKALDGTDTPPVFGDADTDELADITRTVVVTCADELDQQNVLAACHDHGWKAQAITR